MVWSHHSCRIRSIWPSLMMRSWQVDGNNNNFSPFTPYNQGSDYHPYCIIEDFNNPQQVLTCN